MANAIALNHIDHGYEIAARMKNELELPVADDIVMRGIDLDEEVTSILKDLIDSRDWNSIEISDCRGSISECVAHALERNRVKVLWLNGENVHEVCFHELGMNTSLQQLRLTTIWHSSNIESLAKSLELNKCLRTLNFRWSTLDREGVEVLAAGLEKNCGLKKLSFPVCGLEDCDVHCVINAIKSHPTLESLDLNGNKCRRLPAMPTSSRLRSIDFRAQKISPLHPQDVCGFAQSLQSNSYLKDIQLAENNLTDNDAECLAFALTKNSSLEGLYLARNKFTDKGIISLVSRLGEMKSLRKLSLWGNPFGEAGAQALLQELEQNTSLEHLELFQKFSVSSLVLQKTWLNRAGRRIFQQDQNKVPLALWPTLLERANNISFNKRSETHARADALYRMLRDGPALFNR